MLSYEQSAAAIWVSYLNTQINAIFPFVQDTKGRPSSLCFSNPPYEDHFWLVSKFFSPLCKNTAYQQPFISRLRKAARHTTNAVKATHHSEYFTLRNLNTVDFR